MPLFLESKIQDPAGLPILITKMGKNADVAAEESVKRFFYLLGLGFDPKLYTDLLRILDAFRRLVPNDERFGANWYDRAYQTTFGFRVHAALKNSGVEIAPVSVVDLAGRLFNKLRYWEAVCGDRNADLNNVLTLLKIYFHIPIVCPPGN